MRFLALGVDHRSAPAAVREALAFDGPRLAEGLAEFSARFQGAETVVLSTCNRVEIYLAAEDPAFVPDPDAAAECLAAFHRAPAERFRPHLVHYRDEHAVRHLFRVASSLESLVLGEGQILGQVRDAYQAAVREKTVGPILHAVFQHALRVGKRVRETTGLDRGKVSVASVAVDVAREVFDSFEDKTVLVVGAGKMAELTLAHLAQLRPGRILVLNRNPERARAAAQRWNGQTRPFEQLDQALVDADLVVSTTASEQPIVTAERYRALQRARRSRLALILDIAIPRDFEPAVGDLEQVLLYNVDDLSEQAERNRNARRGGVESAESLIDRELRECLDNLRHQRAAGALQRQLGDFLDDIRLRELERLFASRPNLSDEDRRAIAHMAHRLQNQFLHHPRAALRSAAADPGADHPHPLVNAVKHLFGLSG